MPLQIETQPFQFNSTVTGLSSAIFASISAASITGGNSNNWNTAYQSVSSQPLTLVNATNSINTVRGSNTSSGIYTTVAGGVSNTASGNRSNVAGGNGNTASGYNSNVAGGDRNTASGNYSNVAGGRSNNACGYTSNVAGGLSNCATGWWSGIGSGCENIIKGGQSSFIGAGQGNTNSGYASIIGAGNANNIITPQNSIISYWSLDESSGNRLDRYNSNTLYQHNTVPSTTGLINNGIVGNGSGWLETTASFDFSGDFSINYWTIPTTNGSQQQFSGTDRLGLNFNVTNSYIYYGITDVRTFAEYFPPGGIPTNAWSMATLVRYRNYISMYLNGVLVAGPSYNGGNYSSVIALLAIPGGAYVGASNGTKMDEVGIWKRALTNAEVTNLYNNGHGVNYTFNVAASLYYSSIESGTNNYIGSNCSFIAAGSNNNIPPGSNNTFILGSNIQALSANFTYVNSLELANTPSVLILKDTTGKRWKIGVNTSGTPVGLGAA
jgi:hypothetical protein